MNKLILLRHGESIWNKENRFTGWTDVHCPKRGEMKLVGQESCYGVFPYIPIFRLHLC